MGIQIWQNVKNGLRVDITSLYCSHTFSLSLELLQRKKMFLDDPVAKGIKWEWSLELRHWASPCQWRMLSRHQCSGGRGSEDGGQCQNHLVKPSTRQQYPEQCFTAIPLPPEPDAIWEGEGRKSFEKADVGLTQSFKFHLTRHLPLPHPQENLSHSERDCLKFEQRVPSLIGNASILNGDESPRSNWEQLKRKEVHFHIRYVSQTLLTKKMEGRTYCLWDRKKQLSQQTLFLLPTSPANHWQ